MSVTRRTVLASAAFATAGSALAQSSTAPPSSPAQGSSASVGSRQAPGFYRYRIGEAEITAVNDGFFQLPLAGFVRYAELSEVQKAMEEAFLPTNAVPIPFTSLVLRTGGRLVLIDTGNGDMGAPTAGTWMANFRAAGFDPAEVHTIVISHFHGDHINGLRLRDGTAVFPNAEILVPAPEWAFWTDEAKMAQVPEALKAGFRNVHRVFGPMGKDVRPYEFGQEVAPDVTAVAAPGHTPGHTAFAVQSGAGRLMALSDVTNHPALFVRNPDWSPFFDQDADMARATRRRMLDMAASERMQVAFYHAPFPATGFIARDGNRFRFVPAQWTQIL